jgi:hypothetical protein
MIESQHPRRTRGSGTTIYRMMMTSHWRLPPASWKRGFFVLCGYAPGRLSRESVKACQRLHRAAPPSVFLRLPHRGSPSFPTASENTCACTSPCFNSLFLPPTACVSTNNCVPRRAPTPKHTVPLPISLATNIEGSLSLSHLDQCTSHQSRLQISETHCGPPACPRAKNER